MVIGISPNYNYPGSLEKWSSDNTFYASNHGASLITRAIMREFNAEYICDFSDIDGLREKYDVCYLALSTHAHSRRDISKYVDFLEKLKVKVVILSIGVEDYLSDPSAEYKLHPSIIRLLNIATESTNWIGVRGPYTASILQQNGFKNVVPIGCPSVYWNLKRDFHLSLKSKYEKPLIVYHKTMAKQAYHLIKDIKLLGQDFQDQAIFTDTLQNDYILQRMEHKFYQDIENSYEVYRQIKKMGIFPFEFEEWFNIIGSSDFVFGARLHGVICALIQGIPAILATRDLRAREMSEVFNLPSIEYKNLSKYSSLDDLIKSVDFNKFIETYKKRYAII